MNGVHYLWMIMRNHSFHLVNPRPWPILMSFRLLNAGFGLIYWILTNNFNWFLCFFFFSTLVVVQWWRDVIREAGYEGARSAQINFIIRAGVILFIVSEICFFSSFFWAYFYFRLSPDFSLGMSWPPLGISVVDYLGIPFLNTIILLGSGFYITWCHYSILNFNMMLSKLTLIFCIFLGIYFLLVQLYEYKHISFRFRERTFGRTFFTLTGFHGFHVLVGLIFIVVNFLRLSSNSFSRCGLLGLEYSIWYWHFVDLVWLFLYCFVYWWGS